MKIQFENVNFNSRSGPNGFGLKLWKFLESRGHKISDDYDVLISFIESRIYEPKKVLRLDGIYFSTRSDWKKENYLIEKSYNESAQVIVQSEFDRKLISKYFGERQEVSVIKNGTLLDVISKIPKAEINFPQKPNKIWLSASRWRPHKRLVSNIELFKKFSEIGDVMVVAGKNPGTSLREDNVFYIGDLSWSNLISVMKRADNFIHLAWLDHCPNVVIDAKACGCKLYCSSAGGTAELAGKNDVVVLEPEWDFKPIDLYSPPELDFMQTTVGKYDSDYSIDAAGLKYESILKKVGEAKC